MKINKHISAFEAFNASHLSKVTKYLNKFIFPHDRKKFTTDLIWIKDKFDVSIGEIDDNYFDCLSKGDALRVKSIQPVTNEDGIYCLKFWFSMDKGYLGFTYTGNIKKTGGYPSISKDKLRFDEVKSLGIKTGTITTLGQNLSHLKTGDTLIGCIGDSHYDNIPIILKVWNEGGIYAIQNSHSGGSPDNTSDWKKFGRYSWNIASSSGNRASDNSRLSLYIDDGSELTIDDELEENEIDTENPLSYNLPMYGKRAVSWSDGYDSLKESIDFADFGVILYYDRLIHSEVVKPKEIKLKREETRSGAMALLKNEEIRKININRYVEKICTNLGLDYKQEFSPKNLERIVRKILNGNVSIFTIVWRNGISNIQRYVDDLSYLITEYKYYQRGSSTASDVEEKYKVMVNRIKEHYQNEESKKVRDRSLRILSELKNNLQLQDEYKIFAKFLSIGDYLSNGILKTPINSIDDLRLILIKLKSILEIFNNDSLKLPNSFNNAVGNLRYSDEDVYAYIKTIRASEGGKGIEVTNERLDRIDRYIKSII